VKTPEEWLAECRERLAFTGKSDRPPFVLSGTGDDWMHRRYARWLLQLPELSVAELTLMVRRAAEAEALSRLRNVAAAELARSESIAQ
jgi:hypothetical protein